MPGHTATHDAIRVSVLPGEVGRAALGRVVTVAAARSGLDVDGVERAIAIAELIAARAPAQLAADQNRIELTALAGDSALEITLGTFREGGAGRLLDEDEGAGSISDLATNVACVPTTNGEMVVIEMSGSARLTRPAGESLGVEDFSSSVDFSHGSGTAIVRIRGEIDLQTAPTMRLACRSALVKGNGRLVLDLTEATFIDSTGIAALIGLGNLAQPYGAVSIVNTNSAIARALEVTGLGAMFTVRATLDEALAALPAG